MIYRTAHRTVYRNINDNLGLVSYRIAQLTNQVASERRINSPSDDPTGAARVLGTRSTLSAISQYRTNTAVSDLWLSESGNAAQTIKEVLDKVYTLAEQGATDTYSASQREAILAEVEGWFQQIVQTGNTKIGDSYIFSGQKVSTQSFAARVEAQKVSPGCKNSTAWTGQVKNYGSPVFNSRPDLPVQSQDFLIEVVRPGGTDSRWFATTSKLAGAVINGGQVTTGVPMGVSDYRLNLTTTDPRYNASQIRFVAGEANRTATGSAAADNGLAYMSSALGAALVRNGYPAPPATDGPVTVKYVLADSAASLAWASARAAASATAYASAYAAAYSAASYAGWNSASLNYLTSGVVSGSMPWASASANVAAYAEPIALSAAVAAARAAYLAIPAATADYDGSGVITVTLMTDGGHPPASLVTAKEVFDSLSASALAWGWTGAGTGPPPVAATDLFRIAGSPPNSGRGLVKPDIISFNHNEITYEVKDNLITVYLPRANSADGLGAFTASAGAVASALRGIRDPYTGAPMFAASITSGSSASLTFQPSATWISLDTSQPYTLAHTTVSPRGTQNDLIWAVKNNGNKYVGEAGNSLSVQYKVPTDPSFMSPTPRIEFDEASGLVTVYAAADINVYHQVYARTLFETGDHLTAHEKALAAAVTTTANDVKAMIQGDPAFSSGCEFITSGGQKLTGAEAQKRIGDVFDVSLADGNSGDGKINFAVPRAYLSDGYNQPALFRVSQDGGKTWGPPQAFGAGEYQTGDMFYNDFLGHASLTTGLPGRANDLVFTARYQGTWGDDLRVEYRMPEPGSDPNSATSVTVGPNPWNICVTLRTDAQGRVLSTAKEVMEAVNAHPTASQLVLADLANYHEGGDGLVQPMNCASLAVGEPFEVNGKTVITPLGYATGAVSFKYSAPERSDPNLIFQATTPGAAGNLLGVRYTTSADPTFYASAGAAAASYQAETTVRYEEEIDAQGRKTGRTVLVVHLGTQELPSCPDEATDPNAAAGWRLAFPLYACTETKAVTSTAGDVLKAVIEYNAAHPEQAAVWPQFERHPEGWDSTAKVGPTAGTVWLGGGENPDSADQHGVRLQFLADGTSMQVGDIFEVPVGWYRGDEKNMDVNLDAGNRGTLNTLGSDLLGRTGAGDNILDVIQRLMFGLKQNDTEAIGRELPHLKAAIEKVTTTESKIGVKQIRNQFVANTLDQKQFNSESLLSAIEDVDFSRLITDLKNAQTVYEALLGVTGMTTKISLLNYI